MTDTKLLHEMTYDRAHRLLCKILSVTLYLAVSQIQICLADNVSFSPVFPRNEYFADRRSVDLLHDSRGYLWIGTEGGDCAATASRQGLS